MRDIVLMSDRRVAAIPVHDTDEPLQDARTTSALLLDDRKRDPAGAFAHLRAGLLERLLAAQDRLPEGLRLLIIEGYRPQALQQQPKLHLTTTRRVVPSGLSSQRCH
ncbi:MAG: hypothetical protein ACRD2C_08255 [Acidimicrobiales bacterium]